MTVREESAARDNRQDTASPFRPYVLRECATVPDGERGALVGPRGDIAWMCVPRWYSDGVFSPLIGGSSCHAVISADRRFVWGGSHYEDRSDLAQPLDYLQRRDRVRETLAYPGTPRLRSCCRV